MAKVDREWDLPTRAGRSVSVPVHHADGAPPWSTRKKMPTSPLPALEDQCQTFFTTPIGTRTRSATVKSPVPSRGLPAPPRAAPMTRSRAATRPIFSPRAEMPRRPLPAPKVPRHVKVFSHEIVKRRSEMITSPPLDPMIIAAISASRSESPRTADGDLSDSDDSPPESGAPRKPLPLNPFDSDSKSLVKKKNIRIWTTVEVSEWIRNLWKSKCDPLDSKAKVDTTRMMYDSYSMTFERKGIDGKLLSELEFEDLEDIGVLDRKDQTFLFREIYKLVGYQKGRASIAKITPGYAPPKELRLLAASSASSIDAAYESCYVCGELVKKDDHGTVHSVDGYAHEACHLCDICGRSLVCEMYISAQNDEGVEQKICSHCAAKDPRFTHVT